MAQQQQPEGAYPRVTGTMLQSNQFTEMLVSVVGKVCSDNNNDNDNGGGGNSIVFETSDGSRLTVSTDHIDSATFQNANPDLIYEIVGQVLDGNTITAFVRRDLGPDMDLKLYQKLLELQQVPAMGQYFVQGCSS